jgi:hypothetical protein
MMLLWTIAAVVLLHWLFEDNDDTPTNDTGYR